MKKRCAVCGDTTLLNVRLAWRRDRDGKTVNVCCACAEAGRVNEKSIDNYTTADTIYKEETAQKRVVLKDTMSSYYRNGGRSSVFSVNYRRLSDSLVNHIYNTIENTMNKCEKADVDYRGISDMCAYFSMWDKKDIWDTLKLFGDDYNEREAYVRDFFKEVQVAEIIIEELMNTYL